MRFIHYIHPHSSLYATYTPFLTQLRPLGGGGLRCQRKDFLLTMGLPRRFAPRNDNLCYNFLNLLRVKSKDLDEYGKNKRLDIG